MIILAIIEVIIILLLIFLRKRLLIAIALIKEASRSVANLNCLSTETLYSGSSAERDVLSFQLQDSHNRQGV